MYNKNIFRIISKYLHGGMKYGNEERKVCKNRRNQNE